MGGSLRGGYQKTGGVCRRKGAWGETGQGLMGCSPRQCPKLSSGGCVHYDLPYHKLNKCGNVSRGISPLYTCLG